jgi:hypothetical protein
VKLHRFRDVFITNRMKDGGSDVQTVLRTVGRLAGHGDVATTMGYVSWLNNQSPEARHAAEREETRYAAAGD